MPKKCMREHHLGDTYGTAPPNIIIQTNFQLSVNFFVSQRRQENLNFFCVIHEQRSEVFSIAKPDQCPELLIELLLDCADLLVYTFRALRLNIIGIIKEKDRELIRPNNLYFVCAEIL